MNSSAFSSKTSSISSTSLSISSLSFLPASTTLALALASSFGCAPPRLVSVFFSCFSMRPPSTESRRHNQVGVSLSSRHSAYRSEEHTSELQSPCNLVCRLLLEKKNNTDRSTLPLHCG